MKRKATDNNPYSVNHFLGGGGKIEKLVAVSKTVSMPTKGKKSSKKEKELPLEDEDRSFSVEVEISLLDILTIVGVLILVDCVSSLMGG